MKREGNAIVFNFFFYCNIIHGLSHNALTAKQLSKIRDTHISLPEFPRILKNKKRMP
jgi:hypothetical protein